MRNVGFIISPGYQPMGFAVTARSRSPISKQPNPSKTSECRPGMAGRCAPRSASTCPKPMVRQGVSSYLPVPDARASRAQLDRTVLQ